MSERSLIGWLGQPGYIPMTLNVGIGCEPVSPACDFCYAPKSAIRQAHLPGRDGVVTLDAEGRPIWTGKVVLFPERLDQPRRMRKPRMIFINALLDVFGAGVDRGFLHRMWQMMRDTPQHIYVILSKQPKRMRDMTQIMRARYGTLPNVWLGVSVENQHYAEVRVPFLLETPAAVRVISAEPLLGPIDLTRLNTRGAVINALGGDVLTTDGEVYAAAPGCVDWVIVGGETARRDDARAMHPDWTRGLRDQTVRSGRAFFFKQWGSWGPAPWVVRVCDPEEGWHGTDEELAKAKAAAEAVGATHYLPVWAHQYDMKPTDPGHKCWSVERRELEPGSPQAPMRFYPGKTAGHELDGRTWQQWPDAYGRIIDASTSTPTAVTV